MELPEVRDCGGRRGVRDAAAAMVGSGHRIGDHEEGEQQQGAAAQLMGQDGPSLTQPHHAEGKRTDIEGEERPTDVGAPRLTGDHAAHRYHPSRQRHVLAPLAGGDPRSRKRRQREQHAEIGGIKQMLAAYPQDKFRSNRGPGRRRMYPPVIGAQQERDAEAGDDGAADGAGGPPCKAFAQLLAQQSACERQRDLAGPQTEIAQPGAGGKQNPQRQDLRHPRIGTDAAQPRSDFAAVHTAKALGALNGNARRTCRKFSSKPGPRAHASASAAQLTDEIHNNRGN